MITGDKSMKYFNVLIILPDLQWLCTMLIFLFTLQNWLTAICVKLLGCWPSIYIEKLEVNGGKALKYLDFVQIEDFLEIRNKVLY